MSDFSSWVNKIYRRLCRPSQRGTVTRRRGRSLEVELLELRELLAGIFTPLTNPAPGVWRSAR